VPSGLFSSREDLLARLVCNVRWSTYHSNKICGLFYPLVFNKSKPGLFPLAEQQLSGEAESAHVSHGQRGGQKWTGFYLARPPSPSQTDSENRPLSADAKAK
jgi:hypothetical protein